VKSKCYYSNVPLLKQLDTLKIGLLLKPHILGPKQQTMYFGSRI